MEEWFAGVLSLNACHKKRWLKGFHSNLENLECRWNAIAKLMFFDWASKQVHFLLLSLQAFRCMAGIAISTMEDMAREPKPITCIYLPNYCSSTVNVSLVR
jgi:hypothetical protein